MSPVEWTVWWDGFWWGTPIGFLPGVAFGALMSGIYFAYSAFKETARELDERDRRENN